MLLSRQGLHRPPSQTQQEFALAIGGHFAETPPLSRLSGWPRRIVEAFYRVRFGGRKLDSMHQQSIEEALTELDEALQQQAAADP